jgi:hypothetical protein
MILLPAAAFGKGFSGKKLIRQNGLPRREPIVRHPPARRLGYPLLSAVNAPPRATRGVGGSGYGKATR